MSDSILKAYPWLTKEFLVKKIEIYEKGTPLTLQSFDVGPAIPQGENFLSSILRIKTKYFLNADVANVKELNYILKAVIPNEELEESAGDLDCFVRETYIYGNIIAKAECLLARVGSAEKFAPRFYNDDNESNFLLLEDLVLSNFKNADKTVGLDFQHIELTMRKIAKWHAATAVLGTSNPDLVTHLKPMANKENLFLKNYTKNAIETIAKVSREWPKFEPISANLLAYQSKIFEKLCDQFVYNPDEFNVYSHGDFWMNNIMFRYEGDKLEEVVFVDYSFGCWGAVGRDLSYILFSSSARTVSERDWDLLLQCYHTELTLALKKLNYPKQIPTLNDIHASFLQKSILSAVCSIVITGIRYMKKYQKDGSLVFVSQDDSDKQFLYEMYSNPESSDSFKRLLEYFDRKGILQI